MIWVESNSIGAVETVGGKGLGLQRLVNWGANVAPFFVITTQCYDYYLEKKDLPGSLRERMNRFLENCPEIVLRSSMTAEDQVDSSFAGLFETILNVNTESWEKDLFRIFDSLNSDRVKEYITLKNITGSLKMAVVVQKRINVQKSGVLFTRSPITPTSAMAIDAAFGMGEGVVSGLVPVDHYLFTRSFEIIHTLKNNTPSVLDREEIKNLATNALSLEERLGHPCDIEWGYDDEELFIFQIRPITRDFEELQCFVDTNLSESYPGIVSPFTSKFVQKAYENVFTESAVILGAKGKRLETLKFHYARLISSVDGHLYYNLEHYYAILRALPGGEKNVENWHRMIGGRIDTMKIPYHNTELTTLESINSVLSLAGLMMRRKKIFKELLNNLDVIKKEIEVKQANLETSSEIVLYLHELMQRPLGFGLTIVNDLFIMMGLGYLTRSLKKKGVEEGKVVDLLKTSQSLDSIKPLEVFNSLVFCLPMDFIESFEKKVSGVGINPYEEILECLGKEGYKGEVIAVKSFLKEYGDKSFEELKLESLPLRNNPELFIRLIKWAKTNPSTKHVHRKELSNFDLSWPEKMGMSFTRDAVAMREATRLWRERFYHLIRSIVIQLAEQLIKEDKRWSEFNLLDFFSLSHEEWKLYSDGKITFDEASRMIKERRFWQTKKVTYPESIQWVSTEALPSLAVTHDEKAIQGQGVSPGFAEGVALVLDSPNDAFNSNLENFILVTKNTDPAWVYIMSRSRALISEKGSLLSHTAIIGRELSIPTIVGVRAATQRIKTGDRLRVDADKGTVEIL